MRPVVRAAAAGGALAACLAGAFTGALGGPAQAASTHAAAADQPGRGLHVTIGSVSPDIGRPGKTVTVTARVSNDGHSKAEGLTGYLRSSGTGLQYRGELDEYANGTYSSDQQVSQAVNLPDVAPGHSVTFRMSFHPENAGIQQFGVYPLAAEVDEATGATATARTFLPFWSGSVPGAQKLKIAWVWPLIDQPRQGACPAMLGNTLATSLDTPSGGRLGGLLQAGRSGGRGARITWAVDPALLADVNAMTSPYHVLDGPKCRNLRQVPASGTARQWLASLSGAVSQGQGDQPVFTTPYADVDVSALTHAGLDTDLANAFTDGRSAATSVLGQRLDRAGGGTLEGTAWPPGGFADSSVLDNLAVNGVHTAVLDGNEMPYQADYTPDAVTKVATGVGSDVRVLLSDSTLTGVLGGSGAAAGSSPAQTEQWFLAETAMIVAEAPGLGRSVVVAPPQRWNPSETLAARLLSETSSAPWLQPEYLNNLTEAPPPASVTRSPLPPSQVSPGELSSGYLAAIKPIDASVQRFNSILSRPDPAYAEAVSRAESSAWQGGGQDAGTDLISQVGRYVADEEAKVRVLNSPGVTLSGGRGNVPVSIVNQLPRGSTATVKLEAAPAANRTVPAAKRLTIGNSPGPYVTTVTIRPGESFTVRLPVHAQSPGLTDVDLRLLTPSGAPLSNATTVLKVQSTPLGLVAEVITGVAVGVLVLTSIVRVIRRGLREGRPSAPGLAQDGPPPGGSPQDEPSPSGLAGAGPAHAAAVEDEPSPPGLPPPGVSPPGLPSPGLPPPGFSPPGFTQGEPEQTGFPPAGPADEGGAFGMSRDTLAPGDVGDQGAFSSGHGSGQQAGTFMTEDGTPESQNAQQYPEGPDEFADARPRAWPDAP